MNKPNSMMTEMMIAVLESRVSIFFVVGLVASKYFIELDDDIPGEPGLDWAISWLVILFAMMALSRLWVMFFFSRSVIALWLTTLILIPATIQVAPEFWHNIL